MLIFLGVLVLHILNAPFTKVEESFNIQAIHDLIYNSPIFDHIEFPGVVPRTFIGPLIISQILKPISYFIGDKKLAMLICSRVVIALFMAKSLSNLKYSIKREYGDDAAHWFQIFTVSQFHIVFWGSRPLANTFALIIFNFALALWISRTKNTNISSNSKLMYFALIFVSLVYRVELLPLSVSMIVSDCYFFKYSILSTILWLSVFSVLSVGVSVIIDSYYWNRLLWPEFEVFLFNGVDNKSGEWGISPPYYYFTNLLPRIAPLTLPLSLITLLSYPRKIYLLMILATLHVLALSKVPHKEWRFIIYTVPILNMVASIGVANYLKSTGGVQKSFTKKVLYSISILMAATSIFMAYVSHFNYPGGIAMVRLHEIIQSNQNCSIHIDTYTAMTGASRFVELYSNCKYSKVETFAKPEDYTNQNFTHLVTHDPKYHEDWKIIETIKGYVGISVVDPFKYYDDLGHWKYNDKFPMPIAIEIDDLIYIMIRLKD